MEGDRLVDALPVFRLVEIERPPHVLDAGLRHVLGGRCAVALGPADGDVFQGILSSLTLLDSTTQKSGHYLARVVPTAWLLTLARTKVGDRYVVEHMRGHGFKFTNPNTQGSCGCGESITF